MTQSTNKAGYQNVVDSLNAGINVGAALEEVNCLTAQRLRYTKLQAFGSFDRSMFDFDFLSTVSLRLTLYDIPTALMRSYYLLRYLSLVLWLTYVYVGVCLININKLSKNKSIYLFIDRPKTQVTLILVYSCLQGHWIGQDSCNWMGDKLFMSDLSMG